MRLASVILLFGFLAIVWLEPQQVLPDTLPTAMTPEQAPDLATDTPQTPTHEAMASLRFVSLPAEVLPPSAEPANEIDAPKAEINITDHRPETPLPELTPKPAQTQPLTAPPVIAPMPPANITAVDTPSAPLLPKPLMLERKADPSQAVLKPLEKPIAKIDNASTITRPAAEIITAAAITMTASSQNRQHAMKQMDDADDQLALELFWPDHHADREKVAVILRQCFGLTSGYLLNNGKLYDMRGGKVKAANRHFYSPYLRSRHNIDTTETTHQAKLQAQLGAGTPVQLFSKTGDSYIIGGLLNAAGADRLHGRVSGAYTISQGQLYIDDIRVKGQSISGRVALGDARCL